MKLASSILLDCNRIRSVHSGARAGSGRTKMEFTGSLEELDLIADVTSHAWNDEREDCPVRELGCQEGQTGMLSHTVASTVTGICWHVLTPVTPHALSLANLLMFLLCLPVFTLFLSYIHLNKNPNPKCIFREVHSCIFLFPACSLGIQMAWFLCYIHVGSKIKNCDWKYCDKSSVHIWWYL